MEKVRHGAGRCKGWVLATFGGPKKSGMSRSFRFSKPLVRKKDCQ